MLLDPCQTQTELVAELNMTQQCISQRLKGIGMIRKLENYLPHKLTVKDIQRQKKFFRDRKEKAFCIELSQETKNGFIMTRERNNYDKITVKKC